MSQPATSRTSLTDRYVWAATHRLPQDQRADVEAELRATIADMIDARLAGAGLAADGAAPAGAEVAVLTELGDPARLATAYRGQPEYLIGPALFPDYRRLLSLLLSIVPAATGGAVVLARLIAGDAVVDSLASGVGVAFTAALHVAFWTTLGFAIAERSGEPIRRSPDKPWNPSRLPDVPPKGRVSPADAIASAVFGVLAIGLLVWQRDVSWFTAADGAPIPFLNPERWSFWLPFLIAVLAAGVVLDLLRLRRGRWSVPLAAANTALGALLVIPFLGLFGSDPLVNPAFLAEIQALTGGPTAGDVMVRTLAIAVVGATLVGVVDGWIKARRAARP